MFINKAITPSNIGSYTKSLILLMKPRVMSLVIFTCAVGFLTSDPNIKTLNAIISIALVAIGAGAAGCLNMWYEADVDALMTRTCLRPIPTGKVNKQQALIFGILLTIFSGGRHLKGFAMVLKIEPKRKRYFKANQGFLLIIKPRSKS